MPRRIGTTDRYFYADVLKALEIRNAAKTLERAKPPAKWSSPGYSKPLKHHIIFPAPDRSTSEDGRSYLGRTISQRSVNDRSTISLHYQNSFKIP